MARRSPRWLGSLLLALSLFTAGFGPPTLTDADVPTLRLAPPQLQALAVVPKGLTARAALIMDRTTGRIVWERHGLARVAPASTTKMMTAIVALERGDLHKTVVVQAEDLKPLEATGSSVMGLQVGDQLTLEDLLWGLMLPSGNDAAMVIARAVAGSVPAFVDLMNAKAKDLRLKDTHFVNPHGLDDPQHYTTAEDLATIARYALENPVFRKIVGTERTVIQASRPFSLVNTNRLLAYPNLAPGVDGVKTGTTEQAGDCIVASVTRRGRSLIVVVMGSQARNPDAITLIDYAYATFSWLPLPPPTFLTLASVRGSATTLALADLHDALLAPWERFALDLRVRVDRKPQTPQSSVGQPIATATYLAADPVEVVPIVRSP